MNTYLIVSLIISIILILWLLVGYIRAVRNYRNLIKKNNELEKFKGYKEEVIKIKENLIRDLPKGMNEISSLLVDLNRYLEVLEEDYKSFGRHRERAKVWRSPEVKKLRDYAQENKMLTYRLEISESKYLLAHTMLKEKYGEENLDEEWTEYLNYLIVSRNEKEEQLNSLTKEVDLLNRIVVKRHEECRRYEQRIEDLTEYTGGRINAAKQKIIEANDAPEILGKIATAWADYKCLIFEKAVDRLLIKPHPISYPTAQEYKNDVKQFKETILIKYKQFEYKYDYLISLFPELQEYIDGEAVRERTEEVTEEYEDRRVGYLTKEEWESLTDTQKSQLALDRYNEQRKRTKAQVGRDYEEYVAYLFRKKLKGCDVVMFGEQKGLNDLGRDLIVKHKGKVYVVQCKRWSADKVIREKHIMQLFGSTIEYCWEWKRKEVHPLEMVGKSIIPVFVTTTELSDTAKQFSERLGVVAVQEQIGDYPQIKCNVGADGEKIYHLPFDQQYNRVIIEPKKGEFMAATVEEAEEKGFRRAKKFYFV